MDTVAKLRQELAQIQRRQPGCRLEYEVRVPFGLERIDTHIHGGLLTGCVHELNGRAAWLLAVFVAGRMARCMGGDILWCGGSHHPHQLYPPGLVAAGLPPQRIIHVTARTGADAYWTAEEGLRSGSVKAVVFEAREAMPLRVARRLQLASEAGGVLGLIVSDGAQALCPVATTRWQAEPVQTQHNTSLFLALSLVRNKTGKGGTWLVEWNETSNCLSLVTADQRRSVDAACTPLAG